MFIEILSDIPDRQLKAGHRFHEKYEYAVCLIALGKAKEVRDPNAAPTQEANPAGTGPGSTVVPFFKTAQWGVIRHAVTGEIFVQKKYCSETALYAEPLPRDCPDDVFALYQKMVGKNNLEAQFAEKERQKNEMERPMQPKCSW